MTAPAGVRAGAPATIAVPDARLALPAVGCWGAAALLAVQSSDRAAGVALAAALSTVAAAGIRRLVVASLLLGVAIGAAATALHLHALHSSVVATFAGHGATVPVEMTLVRDPVELTSAHGFRFVLAQATVTRVDGRPDRAPVTVLAHGPGWLGLLPGQRLRLRARIKAPRHGDPVAATVVVDGTPDLFGRPPLWQRAAGRVRAALRTAASPLPADERGLVPGLVIGDTAAMPADLVDAFRNSGLTHLILSIRHGKSGRHLRAHLVGRARRGARRAAPARGLREGRA